VGNSWRLEALDAQHLRLVSDGFIDVGFMNGCGGSPQGLRMSPAFQYVMTLCSAPTIITVWDQQDSVARIFHCWMSQDFVTGQFASVCQRLY
jgi:hypothetical protein